MRRSFIAASVLVAVLSASAGAQSVTNPGDPSALPQQLFGANLLSTVGQTFTVPTGATQLDNFTFYLANDDVFGGGGDLVFQPYLMLWNGDHPTGMNLYTGGTQPGNATSIYQPVTLAAGISVTPGDVFVAFLTTAGVTQNGDGYNQFEGTNATYNGGELVYASPSPDGSDLMSPGVWSSSAGQQLAFNAQFSTVTPEPSEFVLLGTGLTSLIGFVRIRRRRTTLA